MPYNLTEIEGYCHSEGFRFERTSPDEVRVHVCQDSPLCFANIEDDTDTYLGFIDSPWHSHEDLILMTGPDTSAEFGPIEILAGLKSGDLLIATRYVADKFQDRWIIHRKEPQDFQYMEAGESICIQRADQGAGGNE